MRPFPHLRALPGLALAICLGAALTVSPAGAQEDEPTGGGAGCVANGNCAGTVYKDKTNLDSWWYPICSGCHFVPTPRQRVTITRSEVREVLSNSDGFWTMHEGLKRDDADVQRNRTVFTRVVDLSRMQAEYLRLMKVRPRR